MYPRFLYRAAILCALLALAASGAVGCRALETPADLALSTTAAEHLAAQTAASTRREPAPEPIVPSALADDGWTIAPPPTDKAEAPEYHWQHAGLDALAQLPPRDRPDLGSCLTVDDPVVVGNAAILLARAGDATVDRCLVETVRNAHLKQSFRRAAIESLSRMDTTLAGPALSELLDEYEDPNIQAYSPELHAELLRGLARHVDAATSPRFAAALASADGEVRQAGLYAFTISRVGVLPAGAVELRSDPNPRVRSAALECLALRRHPQALQYAKTALLDFHLDVRLAAVRALGELSGDEARAILQRLLIHDPETVRAGAILALAATGDDVTVFASARDPSWQVRRSVARALSSFPTPRGATIARQMLADRSAEVRRAVLSSVDVWPLYAGGPIMLAALTDGPYQTRKQAFDQLARRWPAVSSYELDAPAERRAEQLAELEKTWQSAPESQAPSGVAAEFPVSSAAPVTNVAIPPLPQTPAELPPASIPVAAGAVSNLPPQAVAPATAPMDLSRLTSDDVSVRRFAARQLADAFSERPLDEAVVAKLVEIGMAETDDQVWRDLLRAVSATTSEHATELAYLGASHPAAEVRRLGCGYLGAHSDPRHASVLIRAVQDPSPAVVRAAVEALAHAGALVEPEPIERLLAVDDRALQVEAAYCLAINGIPTGSPALKRLARDPDPAIRRQAVTSMGLLRDRTHVETLIALLDDDLPVRLASVASLTQIVGQDVTVGPADAPPALADQVQGWKRWWDAERTHVAAEPPPAG